MRLWGGRPGRCGQPAAMVWSFPGGPRHCYVARRTHIFAPLRSAAACAPSFCLSHITEKNAPYCESCSIPWEKAGRWVSATPTQMQGGGPSACQGTTLCCSLFA